MANRKMAKLKTSLITGFDAFGKSKYNPTESVVQALPESLDGINLSGAVLPTTARGSWSALKKAWKAADPDVIIMLGMAESRQRLSIERFALNIRDYRIADNEGMQPLGETIEKDAPEAMRTKVAVEKLQKHLQRKGYPCEVSNHAGTFVCNDVYFQALDRQKKKGGPRLVLFMHLPMPPVYAKTVAEESKRKRDPRLARSRKLQMALLTDAVLEAVRFCAQSL
ncbi:MAG TPA: pyroglutamyl-peptidase I [Planktothrix sp.]|jgi:pyroglutamyl-peptidase